MKIVFMFGLLLFAFVTKAQLPFEKYPAIKYQEFSDWKVSNQPKTKKETRFSLTIPKFFENQDSLTLLIISFDDVWDSSFIMAFRNNILLQAIVEPMFFNEINMSNPPVRVADINGDGLKDIKLTAWYMGNGTAAMNARIIYLFQKSNQSFTKISFTDKVGENNFERDFDNDNNFEIITMQLIGYQNHSYMVYNLFNYEKGALVNVNEKDNYPIMIQFLLKENDKITDKISRDKMKDFSLKKPKEYYVREHTKPFTH